MINLYRHGINSEVPTREIILEALPPLHLIRSAEVRVCRLDPVWSYFNRLQGLVYRLVVYNTDSSVFIFIKCVREKRYDLFGLGIGSYVPILWFDRLTINGFQEQISHTATDKIIFKSRVR